MVLSKTVVAVILLMCITNALANPCEGVTRGFVNDFSGCRNYFSCVAGSAFPLQCPLGFYFQTSTQSCDLSENVDCSRCPATGILITRNANSCSAYTICIDGIPIDRECETGLWFDEDTGKCDLIENVICTGINNCPETGVAVVPDLTDCTQYLLCSNGTITDTRTCTTGLKFNPNNLRCVPSDECIPLTA